jgi:hypothetical protein
MIVLTRRSFILAIIFIIISDPLAASNVSCEIGCGSYCRVAQPDTYCRACMDRCNSSPRSQGENRSFGAIATTGEFYGSAYGKSSRAAAEQTALSNCEAQAAEKGACEIAIWFYNQCAALAIGSDGSWGSDRGQTISDASSKALDLCRQEDQSGKCHVIQGLCSR